jgi:hypothetical protein
MRLGLVLCLALAAAAASACNSDRLRTHAFVAPAPCGQGPYDVHLRADGTTGGEGIEVIACTPRRLSGHVVVLASSIELANQTFGDVADNQRCVAGRPTVTAISTAGAGGTTEGAGPAGPAGPGTAAPTLIERPFTGSETPFADDLCRRLGLPAQEIMRSTLLTRTDATSIPRPGDDLHVRLWSDAPNDLEGVVFMIRQVTSKKTPAQMEREVTKELAKAERHHDSSPPARTAPPPPDHGPPPAPLLEDRPPSPGIAAVWTPGYWTWTGSAWGWIAGFWRDDRAVLPAPRVELPGAPPASDAVWIGGTWQLQAGAYVWIGGRWRR